MVRPGIAHLLAAADVLALGSTHLARLDRPEPLEIPGRAAVGQLE
jgi:hypothetical protein